jgi:3'(2'), 5'-bisphosphate nucleotidase
MEQLLELAITAARECGGVIMSHYGNATITIKDDLSPVTQADTEANEILLSMLAETGFPILSEETLGIPLPYPETLWVIDPLDGTKGFIKGTGDFSVMIALLREGRPVLGIVYAPAHEKLYYALKDGGAFVEDGAGTRKLAVSNRIVPQLRAVHSVNHIAPYMQTVADALAVTEIVSMGSVGMKAGLISENLGDYYLTLGALGEWDVCAPELILTEAGGRATDRYGKELVYGNVDYRIENGIVFSNGYCHGVILDSLNTHATP